MKKLLKLFSAIKKCFAVGTACPVLIDDKPASLSSFNSDPNVTGAFKEWAGRFLAEVCDTFCSRNLFVEAKGIGEFWSLGLNLHREMSGQWRWRTWTGCWLEPSNPGLLFWASNRAEFQPFLLGLCRNNTIINMETAVRHHLGIWYLAGSRQERMKCAWGRPVGITKITILCVQCWGLSCSPPPGAECPCVLHLSSSSGPFPALLPPAWFVPCRHHWHLLGLLGQLCQPARAKAAGWGGWETAWGEMFQEEKWK